MPAQGERPGGELPARLRAVLGLLAGDGRRRRKAAEALGLGRGERAVLADGPHLLAEAVAAGCAVVAAVGTDKALAGEAAPQLGRLEAQGVPVYRVSPGEMERLAATRSPQGLLAIVRLPRPLATDAARVRVAEGAFVLALDGVQDPGNVGSLARTALAAGVGLLALGAGSARPDDAKTLRASQGALFHVPVWSDDLGTVVSAVKGAGRAVAVAVPRGGEAPWHIDLEGLGLLILGGEGAGVDPAHLAEADLRVTLPMAAGESLGVAAAGAVLLYEHLRQAAP